MDYAKTLQALIADPEMPAPVDGVLDCLRRYPAFYLPAAILLKRNPQDVDPETLRRLQATVSMMCPDRTALADYVDLAHDGWGDFYPDAAPSPQKDTDQTIDAFIRKYGHSSPEEDARIEQLIFNPVPADYFPEAESAHDSGSPLLPPELDKRPAETPATPVTDPAGQPPSDTADYQSSSAADLPQETEGKASPAEDKTGQQPSVVKKTRKEQPTPTADEQPLMESLARIYIKRRNYGRAYEIISKLSLKYPEKSVYFADQLRFLQKLIINSRQNG